MMTCHKMTNNHFVTCYIYFVNGLPQTLVYSVSGKFHMGKIRCTRLAAASDKVDQLLAHGRWFSPGTPASSTTKTGRHDIAEILLKVELNTIKIKIKVKNGSRDRY